MSDRKLGNRTVCISIRGSEGNETKGSKTADKYHGGLRQLEVW